MIRYSLYRIEDDQTSTHIEDYPSLTEGTLAAGHIVEHVDHDYSYGLYSGATRVATFCEGRIGYRAWATRTGRLSPSVEDKYDHDEDRLMV